MLACDGGDCVQKMALCEAYGRAHGVLHTAGVVDDGLLLQMRAISLKATSEPKVSAAWHLQHASAQTAMEALVLYSSSAATFGSVAQANYAAANTVLDSLTR